MPKPNAGAQLVVSILAKGPTEQRYPELEAAIAAHLKAHPGDAPHPMAPHVTTYNLKRWIARAVDLGWVRRIYPGPGSELLDGAKVRRVGRVALKAEGKKQAERWVKASAAGALVEPEPVADPKAWADAARRKADREKREEASALVRSAAEARRKAAQS